MRGRCGIGSGSCCCGLTRSTNFVLFIDCTMSPYIINVCCGVVHGRRQGPKLYGLVCKPPCTTWFVNEIKLGPFQTFVKASAVHTLPSVAVLRRIFCAGSGPAGANGSCQDKSPA